MRSSLRSSFLYQPAQIPSNLFTFSPFRLGVAATCGVTRNSLCASKPLHVTRFPPRDAPPSGGRSAVDKLSPAQRLGVAASETASRLGSAAPDCFEQLGRPSPVAALIV